MTDVLDLRFGAMLPTVVMPAVSAEKMKTMAALLSDSNPIHFDVDAVRALGMGERPVNQGPTNMAYIMNYLGEVFGSPAMLRRYLGAFPADPAESCSSRASLSLSRSSCASEDWRMRMRRSAILRSISRVWCSFIRSL